MRKLLTEKEFLALSDEEAIEYATTNVESIDAKSLIEETDLTFEEYLEKEGGITLEDFMKKYNI